MSQDAIAGIIGALIGAFAVVVISLFNVYIEGRRNNFKNKLEHYHEIKLSIKEQLSEFYDPIYTLLSVNRDIFLRTGSTSILNSDSPLIQQEKKMIWDKLVENVVIPNNKIVCKIIETKLHLLAVEDVLFPYLQFTTHAYAYKIFRDAPYENYDKFRFPTGFLEHVESNREKLRKKLLQLDDFTKT